MTSDNVDRNDNNKWVYSINDAPLVNPQGIPYVYEIQEENFEITSTFYKSPVYDQNTLTVTNTGIWIYNNKNPKYMIIVNKDIINEDGQFATAEDFHKIKLDINNEHNFQIVLKQLNRTITNNGTALVESYSGYSGNIFNGVVIS